MKNYIIIFTVSSIILGILYLNQRNYLLSNNTHNSEDRYERIIWPMTKLKLSDSSIINQFNKICDKIKHDTLIIFKFNSLDCSECVEYIDALSKTYQKKYENVINLTNFTNPRLAKITANKSVNKLQTYNITHLPFIIEKISQVYVFIYTKDSIVSHFFIPEKNQTSFNERMINKIISK